MALTYTNATCDVYRAGNAPPAAPDVAGVAWRPHAVGLYEPHRPVLHAHPAGGPDGGRPRQLQLDLHAGPQLRRRIRPGPERRQVSGAARPPPGTGTAQDVKEVLLLRTGVTYPTNDL